jgi:hypothetical protein
VDDFPDDALELAIRERDDDGAVRLFSLKLVKRVETNPAKLGLRDWNTDKIDFVGAGRLMGIVYDSIKWRNLYGFTTMCDNDDPNPRACDFVDNIASHVGVCPTFFKMYKYFLDHISDNDYNLRFKKGVKQTFTQLATYLATKLAAPATRRNRRNRSNHTKKRNQRNRR